ncbi:Type II secretion system (T2SS), protein F (plasmid) [Neomoorella glycerini]|uniref:Type II secretion system (T2SS), protein F n=1 Tax=Neomoorella glycerini TaxID=55779 RepID=A0A6I5ZVM2_9FIRM|nr:type II secretion system F family protein [Moorella glycerini]QGP94132.1 Type II secretion system (T2SS), protein F [Moorella glycerini]
MFFTLMAAAAVFFFFLGLGGRLQRNSLAEALEQLTRPRFSFRQRARQLAVRLGDLACKLPVTRDFLNQEALANRLRLAGYGFSAEEWLGLWLAASAGALLTALLLAWAGIIPPPLAPVLPLVGFLLPKALLDHRATQKRRDLTREFMVFVEKIALAVSASVPLIAAFRNAAGSPGVLGPEITLLLEEYDLGTPLSQALDNFARRLEMAEADDFVAAVKNALRHGGSYLPDVLFGYAREMRRMREVRIEEIARKMESKTIIPVVLAVFPGTALIVVGPIAISVIKAFIGG